MEGIGEYWGVLEGTGGYWRVLEGVGGYWRVLEGIGGFDCWVQEKRCELGMNLAFVGFQYEQFSSHGI
jgi:hypothetical protein